MDEYWSKINSKFDNKCVNIVQMLYKCTNEDVLKKQNQCAMFFKDYGNRSIFIFLAVAHEKFVEWKQQQKRFPFPLWGSICKEHYVMNWKLSYNVFVCRKETLIYTKKKERKKREIGIHWKVESFVNWKKASILLPPF